MIICKEQGTRIQSATTARKEKTTRPATSGPLREEHLNYTGFLWFFFKSMTSKTVANLLFHVGLVLVLCQKMGNLHSILDSLASFSPDITRTASCVYLLAHRSRRQKPCLIPVHFDMCWHRSCVHASFSESRLSEQQVLTRANLVFDLHNSPVQMHNSWENEISRKNNEPARATDVGGEEGSGRNRPEASESVMFSKVLQTTASRALASMPFAGRRLQELISVDGMHRLQKSWREFDGSHWFCCMQMVCHSKTKPFSLILIRFYYFHGKMYKLLANFICHNTSKLLRKPGSQYGLRGLGPQSWPFKDAKRCRNHSREKNLKHRYD